MANEKDQRAKGMSVREAGRKGGQTVKARYGSAFYERIGRKGGEATKTGHGRDFYESIGRKGGKKGGEATLARHGAGFFSAIGQLGGQKVKRLIEEGKRSAEKSRAPRG